MSTYIVFASFDKQKRCIVLFISCHSFKCRLLIALANFSGAAKDDKMKFAFMMYDEESTGSITHRELVKILRANHMAQSEAEVARKAETIIASLSKNDGTLSYDEMIVISKKFPNILFSTAGGLSSPTSP